MRQGEKNMKKIYSRINFLNRPSKKTPLNAANLNKMDKAIDDLDNRVVDVNGQLVVEREHNNYRKCLKTQRKHWLAL